MPIFVCARGSSFDGWLEHGRPHLLIDVDSCRHGRQQPLARCTSPTCLICHDKAYPMPVLEVIEVLRADFVTIQAATAARSGFAAVSLFLQDRAAYGSRHRLRVHACWACTPRVSASHLGEQDAPSRDERGAPLPMIRRRGLRHRITHASRSLPPLQLARPRRDARARDAPSSRR